MKRFNFSNRSVPAAAPRQGRGHWMPHRVRAALLAVVALMAAPAIAADYVPDPTYNNGMVGADAFAGSGGNNYVGRAIAKLDNGDVIVAGIVQHPSGFGAIGLVRYNASGVRVAWANPGAYGTFGNQYVVLPGTNSDRIESVKKVIVHDDLVFVLADTYWNTEWDTTIFVFGTDGSFKDDRFVDSGSNASGRTNWGSSLATYTTQTGGGGPVLTTTRHLLYVGRKKMPAGNERITYRRYTFTAAGALTTETDLIHLENPQCGASTHCSAFDIAVGGGTTVLNSPRIYITGSRYQQCTGICENGWWAYALQIRPSDGAPTGMGFRSMAEGRGRAIAVKKNYGAGGVRDDIYVLAERDRACKNGMVISAYRNSAPITWSTVIGGSDASGPLCNALQGGATAVPTAIALQDGKLGVTGYSVARPLVACVPGQPCPTPEDNVDGAFVLLDDAGNVLSPLTTYPFRDTAGGPRTRHSGFHDIVASGNDTFTMAGDVRYFENHANTNYRGKMQYATLRVAEPAGNGGGGFPFSDGFESEGGGGNNGNPSSGLSALGQAFFQKLFASQQVRTLVGHQATTIAGVGWRHWQCGNDCSDFATATSDTPASRKHAAVAGWELESLKEDPAQSLDYVTYDLTIEEALNARTRGAINTFAMHTRRIDDDRHCSAWISTNECAGVAPVPANYCARLLPGGQYRAQWLAKLDGYATQLNRLQSGGQSMPFLFRPFHEGDGGWFWWGNTACSDADYKNLFRDTVQYLRNTKGLKHMLVVYAPGVFTTQAQYLQRYPGDDVVDVIAFDQYLGGTHAWHGTTVADLTAKAGIVHALAQARGKIAAWAETGQMNLTPSNAFSQIRQAIDNSGAKLAYMMFWANYQASEFYVPHPGSDAARKTDFRNFIAPPRAVQDGYPSLYP